MTLPSLPSYLVVDVEDDGAVDHGADVRQDEERPDELDTNVGGETTAAFLYWATHHLPDMSCVVCCTVENLGGRAICNE